MEHSGVYFIFLADDGAPKRREARGSLQPYPTLSTGLFKGPRRWPKILKYARMYHFQIKILKNFSPAGPRENV